MSRRTQSPRVKDDIQKERADGYQSWEAKLGRQHPRKLSTALREGLRVTPSPMLLHPETVSPSGCPSAPAASELPKATCGPTVTGFFKGCRLQEGLQGICPLESYTTSKKLAPKDTNTDTKLFRASGSHRNPYHRCQGGTTMKSPGQEELEKEYRKEGGHYILLLCHPQTPQSREAWSCPVKPNEEML